MTKHWILTVLSDDKPGVVKNLAEVITRHQGNWLESQLSQLAGKFAGVVHFTTTDADTTTLENSFSELRTSGIQVRLEELSNTHRPVSGRQLNFSVIGPDRCGIVLEITQAFANYNISVEKLNTACSSMPYSGEPMFEAEGLIVMNEHVSHTKLLEQLEAISDALGVDINLTE